MSPPKVQDGTMDAEHVVLRMLQDTEAAIGAGTICAELRNLGFDISEATVGRILRDLDRRKLTRRDSNRGRVLSDAGARELAAYDRRHTRSEFSKALVEALDSRTLHELVDFFYVRRGLEREAVRLAALRATEADLERVRQALIEHEAQTESHWEHGWAFHEEVALASHNELITSLFRLFANSHESLSRLSHELGKTEDSELVHHHDDILAALVARDPDAAERAMMLHLDQLIANLERVAAEQDAAEAVDA